MGKITTTFNNMAVALNNKVQKIQYQTKKHSPLILTTSGIVGLGATAFLAYQARHKVEAIVSDVEARQEAGEEVPMMHTATRVAGALAPAIVTGGLSVAAIAGAYHILTNRVTLLTSALVAANEERRRYKEYIRENHPDIPLSADENLEEVYLNEAESKKKKGQKVVAISRDKLANLERVFFDLSDEYVTDDNLYNLMFIENAAHILNNMQTNRGFLRLSEVFAALKIPSGKFNVKNAEILGWPDTMYFDLNVTVLNVKDADGYSRPVPCIDWPAPVPIYNAVDYSKVIAEYNY